MKKLALMALLLLGFAGFAAALDIPADQPVCKLYGLIQLFATIGGVLVAAYSGLKLATSTDINERNTSKTLIGGVVIGLIIVWLAPLVVKNLVDASSICGW